MAHSQLLFFAGWLAAALLGGALVLVAWQWLLTRYGPK
jgi:hypothetical protein